MAVATRCYATMSSTSLLLGIQPIISDGVQCSQRMQETNLKQRQLFIVTLLMDIPSQLRKSVSQLVSIRASSRSNWSARHVIVVHCSMGSYLS